MKISQHHFKTANSLWLLVLTLLLGIGCDVFEPQGPATINGRAFDKKTNLPLQAALVRALPYINSTETDQNGNFSLTLELPDSTMKIVTVVISKFGYLTDSIRSVAVQNGTTTTIGDLQMRQPGDSDTSSTTSGKAANAVLVDVETSNIFVTGTGGNETSDITFEIRDANGTPIDLSNQVRVTFRITGGPGGGEYLSVVAAFTDANGRVMTTINSGTIAGALQVVASIENLVISSAPVPIAIHGGLPEIGHFSVASNRLNFAGYNIFGLENTITAFLGDRYSNPVPPGTAVQFRSTGGIMAGSATTDARGRAPAVLTSAAPQPPGIAGYPSPFSEPGFALVTAETVDENKQKITVSTVVLFSGRTQLTVTPTSFSIPPLRSQSFDYYVGDQNLNPLVAGTTLNVRTDNGELSGTTNFTLEDTQSRAATQFSFVLTNANPDSFKVKDATVTLSVTSANGNATTSVTGQMLPLF